MSMNNADFWSDIHHIVEEGYTMDGLQKLDRYAEQFISGRLVYKRFSQAEQRGCSAGGATNVIATILAGAENTSDTDASSTLSDYQRECKQGAQQEIRIEKWAKSVGCWTDQLESSLSNVLGEQIAEGGEANVYDHGSTLIKSIGLDYFIQPILALDRIALHNTYFPETCLTVLGFGRDSNGDFKILVEQPFIEGTHVSDEEIAEYMHKMGFELKNPRNWTYATPDVYLSDMHDENVIRSKKSDVIFVVDCDMRINVPELHQGGTRIYSTEVLIS